MRLTLTKTSDDGRVTVTLEAEKPTNEVASKTLRKMEISANKFLKQRATRERTRAQNRGDFVA